MTKKTRQKFFLQKNKINDKIQLENCVICIQNAKQLEMLDNFCCFALRIEFIAFHAMDVHFKINSINTIIVVTSKA